MNRTPLIKSFFTYGLGNILYSLITLALVPFYLEKLTLVDYGTLSLFLVTGNLLIALFSINISNGILRLFNDAQSHLDLRKAFFSIVIFFVGCFFVLIVFVGIFRASIALFFFNNKIFSNSVIILFSWAYARIIIQTVLGIYRAINKPFIYVFFSVFEIFLLAGINFFIIYFTKYTLQDILIGYLSASCLTIIIALITLRKRLVFSIDISLIKYLLNYGVPLSIANFFSYLINNGNRFFLAHYMTKQEVAIFDVSQKISNLIGLLLVGAFTSSFTPYYLDVYNKFSFEEFQEKVNNVCLKFATVYFSIAILIVMGDRILLGMLSKVEYLQAAIYVPILILSNFMYLFFMISTMGTNILKDTKVEMYVTLIAFISSLGLNFALISSLGLLGASISQMVVNLITIIIILYYNGKKFPFKFKWSGYFVIGCIFLIVSIIDYFIYTFNFNNIIRISVLTFSCCCIIYWNYATLVSVYLKIRRK